MPPNRNVRENEVPPRPPPTTTPCGPARSVEDAIKEADREMRNFALLMVGVVATIAAIAHLVL